MAYIDNKEHRRHIEEGEYEAVLLNGVEKVSASGFQYIELLFDVGNCFYVTVVPMEINQAHILYDIANEIILGGSSYFDVTMMIGCVFIIHVSDVSRKGYTNSAINEIRFK